MRAKRWEAPKTHEARHDSSSHRASSCPSWARTRPLLIQSQACCQLHQGAERTSAQQVTASLEVAQKREVCKNEPRCAPLSFTAASHHRQDSLIIVALVADSS